VPRLIINADDFGLTAGVNRAIVEAHRRGSVTSTTLMGGGAAFDEAAQLAVAEPRLSVGCHVTLVDGTPLLGAKRVPSLTRRPDSSDFPSGFAALASLAVRGRLDSSEMEAEITAQIRRIQAHGIVVSHVDSHKHTHLLPQVLKPLLSACAACGVRAIRNPNEPVSLGQLRRHPAAWRRWLAFAVLSRGARRFRAAVSRAGLQTPDGSIGMMATGSLDASWFQFLIENLPEGTWELVCHPGYNDAALQQVKTRLRESRELELQVLASDEARAALDRRGVELISYREL